MDGPSLRDLLKSLDALTVELKQRREVVEPTADAGEVFARLVNVVGKLVTQVVDLTGVVQGHSDELTELTRQMKQVAEILTRE